MHVMFQKIILAAFFLFISLSVFAQDSTKTNNVFAVDLLQVKSSSLSLLYKKPTASGQMWRYGALLGANGDQNFWGRGMTAYWNRAQVELFTGLQSKTKYHKINFYKGFDFGLGYQFALSRNNYSTIRAMKDNIIYQGAGKYLSITQILYIFVQPFVGINIPLTAKLELNAEAGLPISLSRDRQSIKESGILTSTQNSRDSWAYTGRQVSYSGFSVPFSGPSLALWLSLKL